MQIQKKVETLIEQTSYLLNKQKDALHTTENIFTGFIKHVQAKSQQKGLSQDDIKSLNNINKMLSDKLIQSTEDMMGDIEFLEKQLEALKAILSVKNPAQAETMLDMIIDKNEELLPTEEFKKAIDEDAEIAEQDLVAVINDLKEALDENNIRDVELLLETMGSEGEIEIEFENDECDECDEEDKCDSCEDSCCKPSKKNTNLFQGCCQSKEDSCCGSNKKRQK